MSEEMNDDLNDTAAPATDAGAGDGAAEEGDKEETEAV